MTFKERVRSVRRVDDGIRIEIGGDVEILVKDRNATRKFLIDLGIRLAKNDELDVFALAENNLKHKSIEIKKH